MSWLSHKNADNRSSAVQIEPTGARSVDLQKALTSENGSKALKGIIQLGRDADQLRGFSRLVKAR